MTKDRKLRQKKCKICGTKFTVYSSLQDWCSPQCGFKLSQVRLEKKARKDLRERKAKLDETVPHWTKKAQTAFNRYIRLRDAKEPCISCGRHEWEITHSEAGGKWDCGHYRSVGACSELRFEELNAHKQCKYCNKRLSGNVVEYRKRLKLKIGDENLSWIEGPHDMPHYKVADLKEIEAKYKAKIKELKSRLDDE